MVPWRIARKVDQGRCGRWLAGEARRSAGYLLRWRIRERMRRFLRPSFRRPLPVFFVPTHNSVEGIELLNTVIGQQGAPSRHARERRTPPCRESRILASPRATRQERGEDGKWDTLEDFGH